MKECADKILKMHVIVNCLKKQSLNKFYSRQKNEYSPRMNLVSNSIQIGILEDGIKKRTKNAKDVEVLYTSPASQITDFSFLEDDVAESPKKEKLSAKKEKIVTCTKDRDVVLNASSSYILCYDLGIQCSLSACKQLQDRGIMTERNKISEKKIDVGTQTRKPILLHIIKDKMNNDGEVLKKDKATYAYVTEIKPAEKYVQMIHPISPRFSRSAQRMYFARQFYNREYPDVTRRRAMTRVNDRMSSLSDENCDSEKQYTDSLPSYQSAENSAQYKYVSRIPLYTRLHKYMPSRSNMYRVSESYT